MSIYLDFWLLFPIKFTPQGGSIAAECDFSGNVVTVRIRDSGIGITADKIKHIFEPFVQAHPSLTDLEAGIGLGLAISRQLARGMGGDITVESKPGEGSCFTLTLPRATSTGVQNGSDQAVTVDPPASR